MKKNFMKLNQRLVGMIACLILAVLFSVPSQAKIDPETIVGQWLFDEDKGEKVIDASGNGHDGEIKGSNKRVKGKFGNALEVGADTWVMVPPDDKLKLTAYTVTIWLNTKSDCGGWCGILSKSNDNPTRTYSMYVNANTKVSGMSIGQLKSMMGNGIILPLVMMRKKRFNAFTPMGNKKVKEKWGISYHKMRPIWFSWLGIIIGGMPE